MTNRSEFSDQHRFNPKCQPTHKTPVKSGYANIQVGLVRTAFGISLKIPWNNRERRRELFTALYDSVSEQMQTKGILKSQN